MQIFDSDSPILGDSLGTAERWHRWLEDNRAKQLAEVRRYLDTIYRYAPATGLAAHVVVVQFIHETTERGRPANSAAWAKCFNPAGIGVTGPRMRLWHDFGTGENAALAHLVHLCLYTIGDLPDAIAPYRHLDPRADKVGAAILGRRSRLGSFAGSTPARPTWAADPLYGVKWADRLNELRPIWRPDGALPRMASHAGPLLYSALPLTRLACIAGRNESATRLVPPVSA